jgi:hypothetical protein
MSDWSWKEAGREALKAVGLVALFFVLVSAACAAMTVVAFFCKLAWVCSKVGWKWL